MNTSDNPPGTPPPGRMNRAVAAGIIVVGVIAIVMAVVVSSVQDAPRRTPGQAGLGDGRYPVAIRELRRSEDRWTVRFVVGRYDDALLRTWKDHRYDGESAVIDALDTIIDTAGDGPVIDAAVGPDVRLALCPAGPPTCAGRPTTVAQLADAIGGDSGAPTPPIYWITLDGGVVTRIADPLTVWQDPNFP